MFRITENLKNSAYKSRSESRWNVIFRHVLSCSLVWYFQNDLHKSKQFFSRLIVEKLIKISSRVASAQPLFSRIFRLIDANDTYIRFAKFRNMRERKNAQEQTRTAGRERERERNVDADKLRGRSGRKREAEREGG